MKKQVVYLPLIPRLFSTTLDLLIISLITPYIEIPIYKYLYNIFFQDFALIPATITETFPYKNNFSVSDFFNHLSISNKLYSYIYFMILITMIKFLTVGAYFVTMWHFCGATIGKLFMRMKIVDADNYSRPPLFNLIIRYISYLTVPFGLWSILFNNRKQAFHDKIAHTIVIKS